MKTTPIFRATAMDHETDDSNFYYEAIKVEDFGNEWIEVHCTHGYIKSFATIKEAKDFIDGILDSNEGI